MSPIKPERSESSDMMGPILSPAYEVQTQENGSLLEATLPAGLWEPAMQPPLRGTQDRLLGDSIGKTSQDPYEQCASPASQEERTKAQWHGTKQLEHKD